MKNLLLSTFLFLSLSIQIFGQFNLGLGLGTKGTRSLFLEVEPKMNVSEKMAIGLSLIVGKNNYQNFSSAHTERNISIYHIDANYKITKSGFFIGLGAGLYKEKGETNYSSGVNTFDNNRFSFMPKIGFQRKISVSISGLYHYYENNNGKGINTPFYMLNILYIFEFK